ncbi:MAG: RluA family pseudouridine synthase [Deltaproteobacteria bacterium]|nr:MAG: RluA family pseudouridine synthase [Deltaproteobacteria bacterium]
MIRFVVTSDEAGRIDRIVQRRYPYASRRTLARYFADGNVRVDGAVARKGTCVAAGAVIDLRAPPPAPDDLRPVADGGAPLAVLYADADLVAVAKPAGMPSHPLAAGETGTVANALVARFPDCAGVGDDPREAGLIHRLDTGTTGVLVAARSAAAWRRLRAAMTDGRARKHYLALVAGAARDGEASSPIRGQPAHTAWSVVRRVGEWTLLACTPTTGRMHQIRIHLSRAGHPIVGDVRYGGPPAGLVGHFLHAARLVLPGRPPIEAPMPCDRAALLAAADR